MRLGRKKGVGGYWGEKFPVWTNVYHGNGWTESVVAERNSIKVLGRVKLGDC